MVVTGSGGGRGHPRATHLAWQQWRKCADLLLRLLIYINKALTLIDLAAVVLMAFDINWYSLLPRARFI